MTAPAVAEPAAPPVRLGDLFLTPARVAVRLMVLAFGDPESYEARYSTLSDRYESVEVDPRALRPADGRGRSHLARRSPHPVWTAILARLATIAHALLATALGEVQKVAKGLLAEVPLSELSMRALGYFVPIAVALALAAGLLPGLYYAAIASAVVLAVNVVRVFLHIPLGL